METWCGVCGVCVCGVCVCVRCVLCVLCVCCVCVVVRGTQFQVATDDLQSGSREIWGVEKFIACEVKAFGVNQT